MDMLLNFAKQALGKTGNVELFKQKAKKAFKSAITIDDFKLNIRME